MYRFWHVGFRWPWSSGKLQSRLRRFFRTDPRALPVVSRSFPKQDLPSLQVALEKWTAERAGSRSVLGYLSDFGMPVGLRELIEDGEVGPVQHRAIDTGFQKQTTCVENGIHLLTAGEARWAVHVRATQYPYGTGVEVEVVGGTADAAGQFIESLRELVRKNSVYRGQIFSLESDPRMGGAEGAEIRFHRFAAVRREEIILPETTLSLLERNTLGFLRHAEQLKRTGRSLKRGLLLHGKPGTGKTYAARWLAGAMEGLTTILLTGEQLGLVRECCQMARMLAPALVIMEDVDLIASSREAMTNSFSQVTLHQLMNEMDGLAPSAEVIFLLTTNRPDAIETAIAARPGRIDQAIEFPLPDADCRRRLFDLYARGLQWSVENPARFIEKTEGASPAFIQELIRKAALASAEESPGADSLRVTDRHLETALRDLLLSGGELTRSLLGFRSATPSSPQSHSPS